TAQVTINNANFNVQFVVFPKCITDVILGCDFFEETRAVLNFLSHEVQFPFSHLMPDCLQRPIRAKLISRHCVPPFTASVVPLSFDAHIPDGTSVLLTPCRTATVQKICLPHAVNIVSDNQCF